MKCIIFNPESTSKQKKIDIKIVMRFKITALQLALATFLIILNWKKIENDNKNMFNKHFEINIKNTDPYYHKLSFIYEDMKMNIYGKWVNGFLHN